MPPDSSPRPDRPAVFVSYSHEDEGWKERVVGHLKILELEDVLDVWEDRRIAAGDDWRPAIEAALRRASVAVLLVSRPFLTSRFIRDTEVPRLLEQRKAEGVRVIPVFVHPCPWQAVGWLAAIEGRPRNGQALSSIPRKAQAEKHLADLALEIRDLVGPSAAAFSPAPASESVSSPLDLPPDDSAGRASQIDRAAPLAIPCDEPSPKGWPLDLGMVWLERSAFFGLLAGDRQDGALAALMRSEACLWRGLRQTGSLLPVRWWLQIGPQLPAAPETPAQVWAAVAGGASPRLTYLRDHGLGAGILPGFFFETAAEGRDPELPKRLLSWFGALRSLFSSLPVAIVVHLAAAAPAVLSRIERALQAWPGRADTRIDALRILERRPEPEAEPPLPVRSPSQGAWAGSPLAGWLGVHQETRPADPRAEGSAAWLRAELDALPAGTPRGADRELLEATARSNPERLWALLRAYPGCRRKAARRESLVFAARADAWMDAWLDGAELHAEAAIEELCAVADPEHGPLADDLALALLRRSRVARDPELCEALLERLSPRLSCELRAVDRLRHQPAAMDEFLASQGARGFRLALRAGIDLWPSRNLLDGVDLEQVDLWRLLAARPLTPERAADLLSLADPARRMVFGLCTAREWAATERDPILRQRILDARQQRALTFPDRT